MFWHLSHSQHTNTLAPPVYMHDAIKSNRIVGVCCLFIACHSIFCFHSNTLWIQLSCFFCLFYMIVTSQAKLRISSSSAQKLKQATLEFKTGWVSYCDYSVCQLNLCRLIEKSTTTSPINRCIQINSALYTTQANWSNNHQSTIRCVRCFIIFICSSITLIEQKHSVVRLHLQFDDKQ